MAASRHSHGSFWKVWPSLMFRQASGSGSEQFRDNIHLTDAGQATLARLFGSIANPCGDAPAK
ncbi:MAG: hypothetical protein MUE79_07000 [Nitratireductor sp.]|nr:hypothetical protein [Nitratireductor sp.]